MMKQTRKMLLLLALLIPAGAMAQTRAGDSSPKEPQGATYTLSDGSTVTKTGETISSETQYYNVVQVTKGSLTLDGCAHRQHRQRFHGYTCTEDHERQLDVSGYRQCRQRQ